MQRRERIEHRASADRSPRRKTANDEAIAGQRESGLAQTQLRESSLARRKLFAFEKHNFGDRFRGAVMEMNARAIFQSGRRRQQFKPRIQPLRREKFAGRRKRHAAMQFLELDTGEIYGGALPRDSLSDG